MEQDNKQMMNYQTSNKYLSQIILPKLKENKNILIRHKDQ